MEPNLSSKNLLHAFSNIRHEGTSICGSWLVPELGLILLLYLFLKRGISWYIPSITVGVRTKWKQLLYALVILSEATKTQSYPENFSLGRKFLHRWVTKIGCEYFMPRVCCELEIKCCRRNVFKQTVCYLVIRLWIICNTGLLKDICSRPKMLRWTQRPTQ